MGDTSKSVRPRPPREVQSTNQVAEYAETCVKYVQISIGVALDFSVETLPILDHYLREARETQTSRPETAPLLATVAGCYLGELLAARHPLAWNTEADEPLDWKLTSPAGALEVFPIALCRIALEGADADGSFEAFMLEPKLREALSSRLEQLPAVGNDEFLALSTRVEVIDMAFDLLNQRS